MEGPRPPNSGELDRVMRFLNQNLRSGQTWSIVEEYPIALHQANLHNIRIITENEKIVSHAVVRPLIVKTPIGPFKVGAIGSVVTDPDYRNQGLSLKVIEDCVSLAKEQECEIAILWSNLYEFYRKFGFELAGSEISFLINREIPVPSTHIKIIKGNKIDSAALLRLYNEHTVSSFRTPEEVRKFLTIPNSRVYSAWNAEGCMVAYAIEGKGADLQGYVHEWGGSISSLLPLLNYMFRDQKRPLTLIVPQHSQQLIQKLRHYGVGEVPGFLGMIKILNYDIFNKLNRALMNSDHEVRLEKQSDGFHVIAGENKFKTESEADIIRLVFGPQSPSELYNFDESTLQSMNKVLPVPMWVWGWDSI